MARGKIYSTEELQARIKDQRKAWVQKNKDYVRWYGRLIYYRKCLAAADQIVDDDNLKNYRKTKYEKLIEDHLKARPDTDQKKV